MKNKKNIESTNVSMYKLPKWVVIVLVLNFIGIIGIGVLLITKQKKTAFVDLGILYEGFELSKQKQVQLQSLSFNYKNALDSLGLEIKSLEDALNINYDKDIDQKLQLKKMNYYKIEENMQAQLETEKSKADEQIWLQINTYTQEFGKEHGYDYIYGGNGSGSLMYANNSKDISNEVLDFINKKYIGE